MADECVLDLCTDASNAIFRRGEADRIGKTVGNGFKTFPGVLATGQQVSDGLPKAAADSSVAPSTSS